MNAKNLWLKFVFVGIMAMICVWSLFWGNGLREGIDIRGGHSLTFEIRTDQAERDRLEVQKADLEKKLKEAADEKEKGRITDRLERVEASLKRYARISRDQGDLAQQMISILKDRVDPRGLLSLEWRPLGNNRIEIRMPAGRSEPRQKRTDYLQALEELEENNIQRSEIRNVLQSAPNERTEAIRSLTGNDMAQMERFEELTAAHDGMADAQKAVESSLAARNQAVQSGSNSDVLAKLDKTFDQSTARFEDAQILYEDKLKALYKGNISQLRLERILSNYISARVAKAIGSQREVKRRKETYTRNLEEIQLDYPARAEEIKEIAGIYEEWSKIRQYLDDPADLIRLVAKAGVLEFRIAPLDVGGRTFAITPAERARYVESLQSEGPEGLSRRNERLQWFPIRGGKEDFGGLVVVDHKDGKSYVLLYNEPGQVMLRETGKGGWSLAGARPDIDRNNRPAVLFSFDEPGAKRFARLTSENLKRPMAIMLDDEAYSVATIQSTISKTGTITGRFTQQDVNELVRTLIAGSLPARLNPDPISVNTFGPRIGAVNRDVGIRAAYWGLIAVAVFMLIYYLLSGAIANVALLLNIILVLGVMSLLEAVFTLPGIAGIILTIGIAVDANVLIFERLREEQAKGQSIRQALKNAYERAFSAIFDANITTLLVCLILGWVGTEEVRGFAITLGLGVGFSLFTSLVVTRWIFQVLLDARLLTRPIGMLKIIGVPKIDWMSKRRYFWVVSAILMVMGIVSLVQQGGDIWGIEFSSGTQAIITFRGDALIDGDLPNDRVVRERFIAKAGELGYEKLQATAMVETRVNPLAVRDFLRDYDSGDNPDGKITLAEWEAAKMKPEFFHKVDTDGDGALIKEELTKNLSSRSFQISTTVTDLDEIRKTSREAFGASLQIRTRRSFELVKDQKVDVLGVKMPPSGLAIVTPEFRHRINPTYSEELLDYEGGMLLVLRNIRPPISETEMVQRIREMRSQPDFKNQSSNRSKLIGLAGTGGDTYSSFAIAVTPTEVAMVEKPAAWDKFSAGELAMLTTALEREEAMEASNFDAAIAGEAAQLAIVAVILSWLVIVIYLWFRFGSVRWGLAAVICLIHDVVIVVGLVAASGWIYKTWFGELLDIQSFKIDLAMVAAVLTVIGYSVNDTIVVFDRIRENRGKLATVSEHVINASINQTLARTLLTSSTTLIVVIIMYVMGGAGIHAFSYALLAGIIFGTYSSVAVASPLLMGFKRALVGRVTAPE